MSAYDLAKIGMLILNEGIYRNYAVVSGRWIQQMTKPYIKLSELFGNMYYGYLWYRPYKDEPIYAAIGDGGNVIYVNAKNQVSVGVTGTFKPRIFDRIEFIETHILPLVLKENS